MRCRTTALAAVTAAALVATVSPSVRAERSEAEPTDDEIFAEVFTKPAQAARIPVLLRVAGKAAGNVIVDRSAARKGAATVERVTAAPVLEAVSPRVAPELRGKLAAFVRDAQISLGDLERAGLIVELDEQKLELRVDVPAALTTTTSHTLGTTGMPASAATALRPAAASGYLNTYARRGTDAPAQLRVDGALNIHGYVLEARGSLTDAPVGPHRGDVLLSHDVPTQALRYLAGDFAVGAAALQPGYQVLGIGVTRNYTLQPYRRIQPVGVFHFVLEAPASVTVVVDGSPVQTLSLPAGRHDVRDLPVGAGISNIELVIRELGASERRLQFSALSPTADLLAPGISQFSVSAGWPLVSDIGLRDYAWWRPVLAGRRRWGITHRLTAGISGDADLDRQVLGASLAVGSTRGNLVLDVNASHDLAVGTGTAASIRYDLARAARGTATNTLTLAARAYSADYRSLAVLDLDGNYRADASALASQRIASTTFVRANLRYQIGRDSHAGAYDASLTLSRTFGGLMLEATLGTRDAATLDTRDTRVFVSALWQLARGRGTVHAVSRTSTLAGRTSEVRYTTAGGPPPGGAQASVAVREAAGQYGADANAAYGHDRFIAQLEGGALLGTGARDSVTTATRAIVEVGTALAFAGGAVAWTRPINGSFVIVDRNRTLASDSVGINPSRGRFTARANRFGAGVLTGLVPYRVGTLRVDAPNLAIGKSLGASSYSVLPSYKSGTRITVGEPGTVYLRGTLRTREGAPIALAVGELVEGHAAPQAIHGCAAIATLQWQDRLDCMSEVIRKPTAAVRSWVVMTNRAGRFSVLGVTPGHYTLKLQGHEPIAVHVADGQAGVVSLGNLTAR